MTDSRIVLTTTTTIDKARVLARTLVAERLIACATLIPNAESIYRWKADEKDSIEESLETVLLLKTDATQIPALEARLHLLHEYQIPEFLVLPVEAGSKGYLSWLCSSLG